MSKGDFSGLGKKPDKKGLEAIVNQAKVDGTPEPEKRNVGRPTKKQSEKRKPRVMINVNDAEYTLLEDICTDLGVPIAVFIREQALKKARAIKDL